MKFNKQAVQQKLDKAADELEKAGHNDLAEKVDFYNSRLMQASDKEVPIIRRALARIQLEAKRRINASKKTEEKKETSVKAKVELMKARRASAQRKEAIRKRIQERVAQRKRASARLDALRKARLERTSKKTEDKKASHEPIKASLKDRILRRLAARKRLMALKAKKEAK